MSEFHSQWFEWHSRDQSALDKAKAFLSTLLQDGPMLSSEVRNAAREAGIAWRTLRRAKPLTHAVSQRRKVEGTPAKDWPWEMTIPGSNTSLEGH